MNLLGMTAYDTLFPGALIRVTFGKAHWWNTAEQFADDSRRVYNNMSKLARVFPAQQFPLATDATTWTVDVRTQTERSVANLSQGLAEACNITGTDIVEVQAMEVLTAEKVKSSNSVKGARDRAKADADAKPDAAKNPFDAFIQAMDKLGNVGKWVVILVVALAVIYLVSKFRK